MVRVDVAQSILGRNEWEHAQTNEVVLKRVPFEASPNCLEVVFS